MFSLAEGIVRGVTGRRVITSIRTLDAPDGDQEMFNLFEVTGTVQILAIWGEVTTAIKSGMGTKSRFEANDGTTTVAMSEGGASGTGLNISALPIGSLVLKIAALTSALTALDTTAGDTVEPAAGKDSVFYPILVTQKTGGVETNIRFYYQNTSGGAATGAMRFGCVWLPLTIGSGLVEGTGSVTEDIP